MPDADPPEHAPASLYPETYSVKEVIADLKLDIVGHLDKQDTALGHIATKLDGKADKVDLLLLSQKIDGHGTRITTLEEHRQDVDTAKRFRTRAWAVAGTIGGILAIIAGSLIAALVH